MQRTFKVTIAIKVKRHVFMYREDVQIAIEIRELTKFLSEQLFGMLLSTPAAEFVDELVDILFNSELIVEPLHIGNYPAAMRKPFINYNVRELKSRFERYPNTEEKSMLDDAAGMLATQILTSLAITQIATLKWGVLP